MKVLFLHQYGKIAQTFIERDKISSKEIEILKDRIEELKKDLEQ